MGDVGGHLAQADHDRVENGADEDVGDQAGNGACSRQGSAGSEEDSSADGTTDSDELQMPA